MNFLRSAQAGGGGGGGWGGAGRVEVRLSAQRQALSQTTLRSNQNASFS